VTDGQKDGLTDKIMIPKIELAQLFSVVKTYHIEKFNMVFCGCEDNSLLCWHDDIPQQMKQDGRLVI